MKFKKAYFNRFIVYTLFLIVIVDLYTIFNKFHIYYVYIFSIMTGIALFYLIYNDNRRNIIEIDEIKLIFYNRYGTKEPLNIGINKISKMRWYQDKTKDQITGGMILELHLKNGDKIKQSLDSISKRQRRNMFDFIESLGIPLAKEKPSGDIELF